MATAILVMGATGTVGGAALDALHAAGAEPMALVRDAKRAAQALDRRTPFRLADLANEGSVHAASRAWMRCRWARRTVLPCVRNR